MALINVPVPGQTLGNSRPSINSNFAVIDTAFQVDHEDYNTTNQGMHNRVSLLTQSPVPIQMAGTVQLYSQISAITAQPELVFARQTGSSPTAVQITEFTSAGWANPGWTRLPSGILLKWHRGVSFIGSTAIVDLNVDVPGSPNFTSVFSVLSTTENPNANYNNNIGIKTIVGTVVTFSQFGITSPGSSVTITYLAIGM